METPHVRLNSGQPALKRGSWTLVGPPFRATLVGLGLSLLVAACGPPTPGRRPAPLDTSPGSEWQYAAYLLASGDPYAARGYLEALADGPLDQIIDPPLLLRDLSEARLGADDPAGAAEAARAARVELTHKQRSAQFQADDRRIFEQTLDGLEAAGDEDVQRLTELAADRGSPPSADAWYLLGWLDERHGDRAGTQAAYRAYLGLSPHWAFLREAVVMRQHARAVLGN